MSYGSVSGGRWSGIKRDYSPADVEKLRGTMVIRHTLAEKGAQRLWHELTTSPFTAALGAQTGNQALQMVKAGLRSIYVSGWQVAADANNAGQMYPDQSLYPVSSVPELVKRINNTFKRADEITRAEGKQGPDGGYFVPIIADAESGFGGPLNVFELMKSMIEAGAAAVHFEDQLASEKKCGHMGGKVLVPTCNFIRSLNAARLAADVSGVETLIIARTDAHSAQYITSDLDARDVPFICGPRTAEGFYPLCQKSGVEYAIARGLAYAPYADLVWWETSEPNLEDARRFAEAIHAKYPGKMLAYNCSPSFNWSAKLSQREQLEFQRQLGELGYKFQFVTLAGFHSLSFATFSLAHAYKDRGMAAYAEHQAAEMQAERIGYTAARHQREVGTGYFDAVSVALGNNATTALAGSTENAQFNSGRRESHTQLKSRL